MSSRRQILLASVNWFLQSSLKHILNKSQVINFILELVVIDKFHCMYMCLLMSFLKSTKYTKWYVCNNMWVRLLTAMRLFGTKLLSKPMLGYCQLDLRNKLQWNFIQNTNLFIHENIFENTVCEMAILSRRRWVMWDSPVTGGFPTQRVSNAESVSMWWGYELHWCFYNMAKPANDTP